MWCHPATLMLIVWMSALAALMLLPFQLTTRVVHIEAVGVLALFLFVFSFSALARTVYVRQRPVENLENLRFDLVDKILKGICFIAVVLMGIEAVRNGTINLGDAYLQRSQQAQALLHGEASQSSGFFKVGFLCYPASYVYLARCLIFDRKINYKTLIIFGVLPAVLAGITMGGRTPIFCTIAYGVISYRMRRLMFSNVLADNKAMQKNSGNIHPMILGLGIIAIVFAFIYFINVFIIRAEVSGGIAIMLEIAASNWGITFEGHGAELMIAVLGPAATYIIFAFVWYLVQGVIISNSLFTSYIGDPLLGVYGVDLFSSLMRRLDPVGVSQKFAYLLSLNTYGFFPSAFGTLCVDFLFGGLIFVALWGWFTGVVYRKTRLAKDLRWMIFVPFIVLGIIFSLVNTPVGFANGFVTHIWMVLAFLTIKRSKPIAVAGNVESSNSSDSKFHDSNLKL
jgi:hypothetical protein